MVEVYFPLFYENSTQQPMFLVCGKYDTKFVLWNYSRHVAAAYPHDISTY